MKSSFSREIVFNWLDIQNLAEGVELYLVSGKTRGYEANGPNVAPGECWDIQSVIHAFHCRQNFPNGCNYFCEREVFLWLDDNKIHTKDAQQANDS